MEMEIIPKKIPKDRSPLGEVNVYSHEHMFVLILASKHFSHIIFSQGSKTKTKHALSDLPFFVGGS